jgi:hypothetical protein
MCLFTLSQARGLIAKQRDFFDFPLVRVPVAVRFQCRDCGGYSVRLQCCGSMWCPICNLKKALKMSSQFSRFASLHQDLKKVFLTLTWKNISKIKEDTFEIFRNDFTKKFLRNRQIKKNIYGGLYAFDYTINSSTKQFNFHLHCLIFLINYINQSIISDVWQKITGDSFVVDIRKVNDIKNGIAEVLKYCQSNKLLLVEAGSQRDELISAVSKIRRLSKFGKLYREKLESGILQCKDCHSERFDRTFFDSDVGNIYEHSQGKLNITWEDTRSFEKKFLDENIY